MIFRRIFTLGFLVVSSLAFAQEGDIPFAPLESWRQAVLNGDYVGLGERYAIDRATQAEGGFEATSSSEEIEFWLNKRALGLTNLELEPWWSEGTSSSWGVGFQAKMTLQTTTGSQVFYVVVVQGWRKYGALWRMTTTQGGELSSSPQPKFMPSTIDQLKPTRFKCSSNPVYDLTSWPH